MSEVPKILIVDDDAEIVESLKAILESRGYSVKSARDGSAGLAEAEANPPDRKRADSWFWRSFERGLKASFRPS